MGDFVLGLAQEAILSLSSIDSESNIVHHIPRDFHQLFCKQGELYCIIFLYIFMECFANRENYCIIFLEISINCFANRENYIASYSYPFSWSVLILFMRSCFFYQDTFKNILYVYKFRDIIMLNMEFSQSENILIYIHAIHPKFSLETLFMTDRIILFQTVKVRKNLSKHTGGRAVVDSQLNLISKIAELNKHFTYSI